MRVVLLMVSEKKVVIAVHPTQLKLAYTNIVDNAIHSGHKIVL